MHLRASYPLAMTQVSPDPWPPCPAPFNLAAHVLHAGLKTPGKDALICLAPHGAPVRVWTYAALTQAIRGVATGLLRAGAMPGERVLMRLGNTDAFPIAYLGAIAAGLVAVPTSAQLTAREITKLSAQIAPRLILQDPDLPAPDGADATVLPAGDLTAFYDLPPAPFHMGDPNRPAYIVFTSGTSGAARAVEHAHRAIWARGMMMEGWYALRASDRLLHAGAFNWTFTLGTGLLDPWTMGATALIPAPETDPAELPHALQQGAATIFAAAPGIYRKMLRGDLPPLPTLRHGLSAGEKLPEPARTAWRAATGTDIFEAFGMSECSTFLSAHPGAPAAPDSLGRPQPGRRVALIGPDGREGESGVIAVHASDPGLMLGYLNAPKQTAARYTGDWFLTGDLGTRLPGGDIRYQGRSDDMMNAGGFRVSPIEVETALADVPGVTAIACTDVEIKPGTRVIAAFYTSTHPIEVATFEALASDRLASYKRPRIYISRATLPTSTNGKMQRRVLRDTFEAPDDQT